MTLRERLISDIKNVFMDNTQFADDFVFSRTGLTISVLFDKEFTVIVEDVESSAPAITAADSDIVGIAHGDTLTEVSTSIIYNVIGIQPDGTGITLVVLSQD
jgi:hypothetical protein